MHVFMLCGVTLLINLPCFWSKTLAEPTKEDMDFLKFKEKFCSSELTKDQFYQILDRQLGCASELQLNPVAKNALEEKIKMSKQCVKEVFSDFHELQAGMCNKTTQMDLKDYPEVEKCVDEKIAKMPKEVKDGLSVKPHPSEEEVANMMTCFGQVIKDVVDGKLGSSGTNIYATVPMLILFFMLLLMF